MVEGLVGVVDPAAAARLAWDAVAQVAAWRAVEDQGAADQAVEHLTAADSAAGFLLRDRPVVSRAVAEVLAPMAAVVLDRAIRKWHPELARVQPRMP